MLPSLRFLCPFLVAGDWQFLEAVPSKASSGGRLRKMDMCDVAWATEQFS